MLVHQILGGNANPNVLKVSFLRYPVCKGFTFIIK